MKYTIAGSPQRSALSSILSVKEISAMSTQQMRRIRIMLTGLVMLAELLHLAWEYTHGGVHSHHILNRPDLPAISNGWGALLLPLLSWFLFGHILRRVLSSAEGVGKERKLPVGVVAGFV